jgi:hypothetical protein
MSTDAPTLISGAHLPPADAPAIAGVVIERELGRGGMGAVWLGRQTYLDRAVAVKALTLAGDEAFAARFQREARILAGLAHPHIVACHQAGIAPDGRPFLVMEFVDGPDLKRHIAAHGPVAPDEAARLVAEVAEGLRHAAAQGIIHRDVKPENVLLARRPDGGLSAKLADLGLARPTRAAGSGSDLTAAGQILGTPATMAPEQFDDPESVDQRADVYGLGCVLHHALTGAPAFSGSSFAELVASKVAGPPPDASRLRAGIPPALAALCRRMLARNRDERPGYDEVIAALRSAAPARPARRATWPWLLGAVLAAIVVGFVAIPGTATVRPPAQPAPAPPPSPTPPAPPSAPALTAPLDLLGADFHDRLAAWTVADPTRWGVPDDREDLAVAGSSGRIVRALPAVPGRLVATLTIPTDTRRVRLAVADASGRESGILLTPVGGITATLAIHAAGSDPTFTGSGSAVGPQVAIELVLTGGRLAARLDGQEVGSLALPATPVSVLLEVDATLAAPVLLHSLRAEP